MSFLDVEWVMKYRQEEFIEKNAQFMQILMRNKLSKPIN
jgi:hypothetical protein